MTAKGAPNAEAARLYQQGMALLQRGQAAQAVPIFARLTAMPVDAHSAASVCRAFGFALHACGRSADAIAPLREAEHVLKTDPSVPQALAYALRMVGRHDEAIQACRRCLKLDPGRAMVIALEIELLVRARRDEEARRRIGEADGAGIVDANIDVAVSVLALRSGGLEEAISRLQRRIDAGLRTKEERVTLFFSLGHVLDAAGRYDEAWAAYTQGNEAIGQTFDVDRFHAGVEAIVRGWTPERIESLRAGGVADERPVLVVGMPRSGTTVVERALAPHPAVHAAGEITTLAESAHLVGRATGATIDTAPERITAAMITPAAEHYARELDRLAPGAARVTNKLPMNVAILGFFAAMFPRGRIVHCRRDPRDVGLSCYFRDFHAPTPYAVRPEWIGEYYRGYARLVGHWRDTFAKLSDPPGVVEVTYEEFVRDPESGARALVAGVGLAWDDACVAPVQDDRLEITQRADQSGRGVYGSSVGRHEHYAAHTGVWRDLVAPSFSDG